jgi:hypothetical protein
MRILLKAIFLLACLAPASAFPTGAGGCAEANPAVGGFHVFRAGDTGGLGDGELIVFIDDIPLDSALPHDLFTNTDYTVTLAGYFRGFLLRLASPSDVVSNVDFLTPEEAGNGDVQLATVCNNIDVAGVTHVINDVKTEVSATLNADTAYEALFDVTVSISRPTSLLYAYFSRRHDKCIIWCAHCNISSQIFLDAILLLINRL